MILAVIILYSTSNYNKRLLGAIAFLMIVVIAALTAIASNHCNEYDDY